MPCQTLGNASSITQFNEDAWPLFLYGILWQLVPTTEMTSKKSHPFFKRKSGLWLLKKFCICQIVNRHENSETVQILLFRRLKHRTNKSNKIDKIHPNTVHIAQLADAANIIESRQPSLHLWQCRSGHDLPHQRTWGLNASQPTQL